MEEVLFEHERCHVFRLPPRDFLVSASWEGNHIWSGLVRIVRVHREGGAPPLHEVRLVDTANGSLFGACPLPDEQSGDDGGDGGAAFQPASDSSRSFVLRVVNGTQHAFVGINFDHKADAFRFCNTVIDRNRHLRAVAALPVADRALHGAERIQIDLAGKLRVAQPSGQAGSGGGFVAPETGVSLSCPPAAAAAPSSRRVTTSASAATARPAPVPAPAAAVAPPPPQQPAEAPPKPKVNLDDLFK